MIAQFNALAGDDFDADHCVIGSGPAGMTIALELGRAGRSVLLLEAGSDEWTDDSQDVYIGKVAKDEYFDLDVTRLRYLGGSSGHWSGWCRPMDAIDFEAKDGFPQCAWPISKSDIDPYQDQTSDILDISRGFKDKVIDPEHGVEHVEFKFSPPTRFGDKFRAELEASANIKVLLNANVTLIETDGQRVTGLKVEDYDGNDRTIRARNYVLATGGIENSRILMWSDRQQNGALLAPEMPIGRYWMEHPDYRLADALVPADYMPDEFFALTAEKQRSLGVLNCGLRFRKVSYGQTKRLLADLACSAPSLGRWSISQVYRKLTCGIQVRSAMEQIPHPESRIILSDSKTDRFGIPRVELHWQKLPQDLETGLQTVIAFGEHLRDQNIGFLKVDKWLLDGKDFPTNDQIGSNHHLGGTRMAETPTEGVVDRNCRVFGQDNLYVAGSSIFTSGGYANPTFTIVQLSLRLADHLKSLA